MKFEDKINAIIKTLNEDIGTGAQPMAGNPNAVNPAQVAPQAGTAATATTSGSSW